MYKKFKEGRNNKVFLLKKDKQKLIAKKYKKGFTTKYSRFLTVKTFLKFLNKKKIKIIPKIISVDKENEIIFFNFIKGYSIKRPNKKQLNECLKFLVKIIIGGKANISVENFGKISFHSPIKVARVEDRTGTNIG